MRITFDPAKRDKTLAERGLDFADSEVIFAGVTLEFEDTREDYGETRMICYGLLQGRIARPNGPSGIYAAWRGSSRFQYEESK